MTSDDTHSKGVGMGGRTPCLCAGIWLVLILCSLPQNGYAQGRDIEVVGRLATTPTIGLSFGAIQVFNSLAYVTNGDAGLMVIDVANPTSPTVLGSCPTPASAVDVFVSGNLACVATENRGLQIIDVTSSSAPVLRGCYQAQPFPLPRSVQVVGHLAYVADYANGLGIIDISDPSSPTLVGSYPTGDYSADVCVSGDLAYLSGWSSGGGFGHYQAKLRIIDVRNPRSPVLRGLYTTTGMMGVYLAGSSAYLSISDTFGWPPKSSSRIEIIDVSNPSSPKPRTVSGKWATAKAVFLISGNLAYTSNQDDDLEILDVTNPLAPTLFGSYDMPGSVSGLDVADGLIYVTDWLSGLWVLRYSGRPHPDLVLSGCDFSPKAPTAAQPGAPVVFGAFVENAGRAPSTSSCWLEFWGSRRGGLTLDTFLADSARIPAIPTGGAYSYTNTLPLYGLADGPYTVVYYVDRPNEVQEFDEWNNRTVVTGRRLLVLRPQTNADLVAEGFGFEPNPVHNGNAITLSGHVRNAGTEESGPFWIEFWGSCNRLYPQLDFFLCDSIQMPKLAPGGVIDLSTYTRTLYNCPTGVFMAGVFVDRPDQVNEIDETNNYAFVDGIAFNQALPTREAETSPPTGAADLVVVSADFQPGAPVQAKPGSNLRISVRVENHGTTASTSFWLEFWGSKLGGLALDQLVADSELVPGIPAGDARDFTLNRSLYSIPDGPYTIVAVADRLGEVAESNEGNNRLTVARKRLLVVRPLTQANLIVDGSYLYGGPYLPWHWGQQVVPEGMIRNAGTQDSGPFWIEFWCSRDQNSPNLDFFVCDSIPVANLAPGASLDLTYFRRTLYSGIPSGDYAILCFVDRSDIVNETNEADNYSVVKGYSIAP